MKAALKTSTLALLLVLAAYSSTLAGLASGEVAAPSVPQFGLATIDSSHYEPAVYSVDPYTGQTVLVSGDYNMENITVLLSINNQPFTSSTLSDGSITELHYVVRFKGHFEDWGNSEHIAYAVQDASSANTVFTYFKGWGHHLYQSYQILPSIDGGQIDFQVKAMVGYNYSYYPSNGYPYPLYDFAVFAESDWSQTQTITLPSGNDAAPQVTPTQPPTTPQYPESAGSVDLPHQQTEPNFLAAINVDIDLLIQAAVLAVVVIVVAALILVMVRPK
jgi:hypothetical protein